MMYRPFGRTGLQVSPLVLGTDNFANPTPKDECFAILDAAVDAGINLIDTSNSYAGGDAERIIGSSTAPAWHLVESMMTSLRDRFVSLVSEQSPYNLLDRRIENELIPVCQRYGMALFTWSPLAMGMLAGRYSTADAPPADSRISLRGGIYAERVTGRGVELGNRIAALAREAGYEPAQFATAWVKDQPGITAPIIGPRMALVSTALAGGFLHLSSEGAGTIAVPTAPDPSARLSGKSWRKSLRARRLLPFERRLPRAFRQR